MSRAVWIALLLCIGCENPSPQEPPKPREPETLTPPAVDASATEGPITVNAFKVLGSQNTYQTEGAPKPEELQQAIVEAFNGSPGFKTSGGRAASGSATYEIQVKDGRTEVMLFGGIKPKGDAVRGFQAEVLVTDADIEDKTPATIVAEAQKQFVTRIAAQVQAEQASNEELLNLLNDGNARLVALQELRDRRLRDATPRVREFLVDPDARVRVASAATLVAFEDLESYAAIIRAAEDLSRERNNQLMPMLYIIADIPTDEARTYLQALADGHEVESVRKVAAEALAKKP